MISERERIAIEERLDAMEIDRWRPLDSAERDLVRRALRAADVDTQPAASAS